MIRLLTTSFILLSLSMQAQLINMTYGGWDTTTACTGVVRDHGGAGNYQGYAQDYLVIDPPGNDPVNIQFTSFSTFNYSDVVRIYEGVGTSGVLIGTYSGSALPNSGNTITSSSGAVTIYFYSNCCSHGSGFQFTYTSAATSAPTASFIYNPTSPAYNSPVNFINTSVRGGTYLWDFGDGTTSTEQDPVHRFTTSGANQVKLIATNCAGTDTSNITTINIPAAPAGSVSADTVKLTAACGTTASTNWTISNSSGGNMTYGLQVRPSLNNAYYESFETGLGSFQQSGSTSNHSLATSNGANGTSSFLQLGNSANLYASFNSLQPSTISYYVRDESYAFNHGNVEVGDGTVASSDAMFFSYFRYNDINFTFRDVNGWTVTISRSRTQNTWHKVELRNIDYTQKTFDLYLDNALVYSNAAFYDSFCNHVDIFRYQNYSGQVGLDEIFMGNGPNPSIITYNPNNGTIASGNSNTIFLNANTAGLNAGVYYFDFVLSSNDTTLDGRAIPLQLTVTGTSQLNTDKSCEQLGNIYQNIVYADSLLMTNTGCDSLQFSSITTSSNRVTPSSTSAFTLAPGDSLYFNYNFSQATTGTVQDTLYFNGADSTFAFCFSGTVQSTPVFVLDSSSYTVNVQGCLDSVQFNMILQNTGSATLNWGASGSGGLNSSDDFETGTANTDLWASVGSGIQITNTSNCGSINNYIAVFNGSSNRYLETVPLNLSTGGNIQFDYRRTTFCNTPEFGEDLLVQYSTDNGLTWTTISNYYTTSTAIQTISLPIPAAAQANNVKLRFYQQFHSSTLDIWLLDNVQLSAVLSSNASVSIQPDTASLASNQYDTLTATIQIGGLATGTYSFAAFFNTNDPANPLVSVPIQVNITGVPHLITPLCESLDTVISGSSLSDSILVYNAGCGDLIINNTSFTGTAISLNNPPLLIAASDSAYLHYTYAPTVSNQSYVDTLTINSNDTTRRICFGGFVMGAPIATIDTSAINVSITGCGDSTLITRTLYNTGASNLNYSIGSNSTLSLQEVLDSFKLQASYLRSLVTNPYNFSEGIFSNNIGDGGGDMYDGGNYINTVTSQGSFNGAPYSQDLVINSTRFGNNGAYFTYKATGMWLLAADLDNVSRFSISGDLGADGSGTAEFGQISTSRGGRNFTGFYKRVFSAGDPSVNHLIIVETNSSQTQTSTTYTNNDFHQIDGLSNNTRLYYLLFAGSGGTRQSNQVFQDIMENFLSFTEEGGLPSWIEVSPDSGNVAASDSIQFDIWIKSAGLSSGTHSGTIGIATNNPSRPMVNIPVNLTLTGSPEALPLNTSCMSFTGVLQGVNADDTLRVANTGCDSLHITSANFNTTNFSALNLPLTVEAGDTGLVFIRFNSLTVGSFADTATFANNDTAFALCLNATSVGAPLLQLPEDTLYFKLNKCKVVGNKTYRINNAGQGSMNYSLAIGQYRSSSTQTYNTSGASTTHNFTGVPATTGTDTMEVMIIVHGDYDEWGERTNLYIDNQYVTTVYDNNRNYQNDTIIFTYYGFNVNNWTSNNQVEVRLQNTTSVDGGAGSFHQVHLRVRSQVNWVAVAGASSGNINPGAGTNANFIFNATLLAPGSYNSTLNITTNNPAQPQRFVPIVLDVVSEPELKTTDTCLLYPLTLLGDTTVRSFSLYNDGCAPLNISAASSTNGQFVISPVGPQSIAIGDSVHYTVRFVPTAVGSISASIIVLSNDDPMTICINAGAGAKPISAFTYSPEDPCKGEIAFLDQSQFSPSGYLWQFGDGNTSLQSNPTHFYTRPGTYRVRLRVSNTYGFDTSSTTVTVDPFYVDFSASNDTVQRDSLVSFYDSSITATSWSWNFGDGNTSTLQNPTHTYTNQGVYNVELTATDARSCTTMARKTIRVIYSIGLEELQAQAISLYPNPAGQMAKLEWSESLILSRVVVIDGFGKRIALWENPADQTLELPTSDWARGLYSVQCFDQNGKIVSVQKLLVQH